MTSTTSTAARSRRTASRSTLRARGLVAGGLLAAALALGACSASSDSVGADTSQADVAPEGAPAMAGGAGENAALDTAAADLATRQVVQVGDISVAVEDLRAATDTVVGLAEKAGGRVDDRSEHAASQDDGGTADLTIRVPAAKVSTTVDALGELGTVEALDLQAQDVTVAAKDLDARIHALELSVARMEDLLARATTTEALMSAENALTDRQSTLEQLQSQRTVLADQVSMSTLRISLHGPDAVTAPPERSGPGSFVEGLASGWHALTSVVQVLVVLLGVLLPWLALAGAVAAGVVAVLRWRRGRTAPAPGPVSEPTS